MKEKWRNIEGYEGYYQVSNFGNVRSLERKVKHSSGSIKIQSGKLLTKSKSKGYERVLLSFLGKVKCFQVHRLVAETFIPNPHNNPQVNHIDMNKLNNHVDNLEWVTAKENIQHAILNGVDYTSQNGRKRKTIRNDGVIFESLNDASRKMETPHGNILRSIKKGYKVKGYTFKYYKEV